MPLALALVGMYLLLQLIVISSNFLVLMCAAGLVAVMLNRIALAGEEQIGLPRKIGVIVLFLLLAGGTAVGTYVAGAQLVSQYADLGETLPKALQSVRETLLSGPLGAYIEPVLSQPNGGLNPSRTLGSFANWFGTAVGVISSLFFFLAVHLRPDEEPASEVAVGVVKAGKPGESAQGYAPKLKPTALPRLLSRILSSPFV